MIFAPPPSLRALSFKESAHYVYHGIDAAGGIDLAVGPGSAAAPRGNDIEGSGDGGELLESRTLVPSGAVVA